MVSANRTRGSIWPAQQHCYRYQAKQSAKNVEIADHLVRLTHNQRNWGFGLCFRHLRNAQGHRWNHKRVYRIYRELELNLRIRGPLAVKVQFLQLPVAGRAGLVRPGVLWRFNHQKDHCN